MDIPRESAKRQRRIRRIIYSVLGLLARISHQLFGTGFEGPERGGCGLALSP